MTNLRTICEECGLLVIGFDCLRVKLHGARVVTGDKGLVALILEVDRRLGHGVS